MSVDLFELVGKISVDRTGEEKALTDTQKKLVDLQKEYEKTEQSAKKAATTSTVAAKEHVVQAEKTAQQVQVATTKTADHGVKQAEKLAASEVKEAEKTAARVNQIRKEMTTVIEQQSARSASSIERFGVNALLGGGGGARGAAGLGLGLSKDAKEAEQKLASLRAELKALDPALEASMKSSVGLGSSLAGLAGPVGLAAVGIGLLGAGVLAAGAGIFKVASDSAKFGDDLYDLSQKVNVSAHDLSAWKIAAEQSGGSIQNVGVALAFFQKNMEAAHNTTSKQAALFKALHIDIDDTNKALNEAGTALVKMAPGQQQTALSMQLFNKSGKEVLGMLKQMGGDIPGFIQQMDDMGLTISNKDAKASNDFSDALKQLQTQLQLVEVQIGQRSLPALTSFFEELSERLADSKTSIMSWGGAFEGATNLAILAIRGFLNSSEIQSLRIVMGLFASTPTKTISETEGEQYRATGEGTDPESRRLGKFRNTDRVDIPKAGGGKKGGSGVGDRVFQAGLKALEDDIKETERLLKSKTDMSQREYDLQWDTIKDYTKKQIAALTEAHDAVSSDISQEKGQLEERLKIKKMGADKAADLQNKLTEVNNKQAEEDRKYNAARLKLSDQGAKFEEDRKRQHNQLMLDLSKLGNDRLILQFEDYAKSRMGVAEKTQKAIDRIEIQNVEKEIAYFTNLKNQYTEGTKDYNDYKEKLARLEASLGILHDTHFRKERDARHQDLQDAVAVAKQRLEVESQVLEASRARLTLMQGLGTMGNKMARREGDKLDLSQLTSDYGIQVAERKKAHAFEIEGKSQQERKAIDELYNNLILGDYIVFTSRKQEIENRANVEQMQKFRDRQAQVVSSFESAFVDGFNHIGDGWKSMLSTFVLDFTHAIAQMILQAEAANIAKKLFGNQETGQNGSGWLGKLLKTGLGIAVGAAGGKMTGFIGPGGWQSGSGPISVGGGGLMGASGLIHRAGGGDVPPFTSFIAGEMGQELVTSGSAGAHVYNASDTQKMGGHTFNVTFVLPPGTDAKSFQSPQTQAQIARKVKDTMQQAARRV